MKTFHLKAMTSKLLVVAAAGLLSSNVAAQTCYDTLTATSLVENFSLLSNGLAQDKTTGLMWMRCAYGQSWDNTNSTCTGSPQQITWQDALQASVSVSDGGYTDWRLPNVKEIATIVEKSCVDPSLNETVFPASSSENYWTSSTVVGDASYAWGMAFYNGRNNTKEKLLDLHVRFVRYAE